MMKWLIFMLSCWVTLTFAQSKQVFQLNPIPIEEGKELSMHYNPAANGVSADTEVKGSIYLFKDFKWQGYDLPLIKSDTGYSSKYQVPVGTSVLVVRYALGDSIDRGRWLPYAVTISNSKLQMVDGALTEWGLLRSKDLEGKMSPLVSEVSLIEPKTLVQLWISQEYHLSSVRRNLFVQIANGINSYFPKGKADSVICKGALEISNSLDVTEKELISIEKVYRMILKNTDKADSLKTVILSKYPKGLRHRLQRISEINMEQNKDRKLAQWDNFVKEYPFVSFPYSEYRDPLIGNQVLFDQLYVSIADLNFQKPDINKLTRIVEAAPIELVSSFYKGFVIGFKQGSNFPVKEKEILPMSISFTQILLSRIASANLIDRGIFAPTEWKKEQMNANTVVWINHINLLCNNNKYNEAKVFADQIKNYIAFRSIEFNTVYVRLLYHFGQKDSARAYILSAVAAGMASPEIIHLLKDGGQHIKGKESQILLKS